MSVEDYIRVPKAAWDRLCTLEAELPALLKKARQEGGMDRLKVLNQHHKDFPEEHRRKSKEWYALKREQILAKRREAYRRKKAATAVATVAETVATVATTTEA